MVIVLGVSFICGAYLFVKILLFLEEARVMFWVILRMFFGFKTTNAYNLENLLAFILPTRIQLLFVKQVSL
jgi:hypothetical protein